MEGRRGHPLALEERGEQCRHLLLRRAGNNDAVILIVVLCHHVLHFGESAQDICSDGFEQDELCVAVGQV